MSKCSMALVCKKGRRRARVEVRESLLGCIKGLMFSKPLKTGTGLLMKRDGLRGIHMLFVFFPIDVLWIDKKGRVVQKNIWVQPFTFNVPYKGREEVAAILELPAGSSECISVGDLLEIK